ncbi:MAG: tRNA epoxyqueuosine(34) reductase QueG, partial [Chlorobiaceae bacterium]|nr:tRNA epoxyqueuosine(34) reductase QueG [Chlorobiaceae bacterium]
MAEQPDSFLRAIKKEASRLGFCAIGFSSVKPQTLAVERLQTMIDEGRHGEMNYLANSMKERVDPSLLLPGTQTIISAAISYNTPTSPLRPDLPRISNYALIEDYHIVLKERLRQLFTKIEQLYPEPLNGLITVDSAPVLEKTWAEQAGIGASANNTLLIVPAAGSYVFIGEILIDKPFESDRKPLENLCGSCRNCIENCPTGALVSPGKIDARRCISYLTVELKRDFTAEESLMAGTWLFGCDCCQECCPYNRGRRGPPEGLFQPKKQLENLTCEEILNLSGSGFKKLFFGTPIYRIG